MWVAVAVVLAALLVYWFAFRPAPVENDLEQEQATTTDTLEGDLEDLEPESFDEDYEGLDRDINELENESQQ